MLSRVVENIASPLPIEDVNIDTSQDVAIKYGIRGVPTCVIVDDAGTEIKRHTGMMNEAQFKNFVSV